MKFSILVPVYNVEQYLEQCVESLLNQTFKDNYEIILVDDGSTDSSGKLCDKYAKKHPDKIKVIHKENGGHSSARREAIRNATGEYSLFCDSDDFVETNLLEIIENVLNKNSDTDMVIYSFSYYENGKKVSRKISVSENTEIYEDEKKKKLYDLLITTPHINSLCTKAIKTNVIKNVSIDYSVLKDKDIAEDTYIVSCFVTACKKIVNINDALYNYRTNQKSISRSFNPDKISRKNLLFLYKHFINLLPVWEMDNVETKIKIYNSCFDNAMYQFRKHYEYSKSKKDLKKVLEFDWNSMLFDDIVSNPSKYGKGIALKLYEMLLNKKYFSLRIFFFKNKIYNCIKKIKRTVKGV